MPQNWAEYYIWSEPERVLNTLKPYLQANLVQGSPTREMAFELYRRVSPTAGLLSSYLANPDVYFDGQLLAPVQDSFFCPEGTIALLASDGVFELVTEFELIQLFFNHSFEDACSKLRELVLSQLVTMRRLWRDGFKNSSLFGIFRALAFHGS